MTVKEQVRPENSSQYVNYDEFIDYQLKKTKTGIHHADLLSGLILFGVGVTAYLLLFAILDQWVVPGGFSSGVRTILTLLFGVSCVGWIGWKVIWPSMRRVNALYAAREIERAHPEFKSSLMTWVDFRQTGREVPEFIQTSLEKRTATQISKSSIDDAIDRRVLMKSSYLLLGLVVLFCLYTLFSPKRMSTTLWRALMPLSAVSAATRTEIRDIKPGNTEVLARDQVDVTVELGGHIPPEVTLFFSTADRRFVNEPIQLRRTDEQRPIFQTRLTGDGGKGLLSDVSYHIVAGDAKSANYEIRVNQPPTADVTAIQYDYPQYMGLARSIQQTNAIDAWEGTWVTVTAQPNMPVKKAILYCSDQETIQDSAEAYPMQIQDDRLTARWQLRFRDDGTFARYFHVQVWNERNQTDPQPTVYRIKIRPDLKPEVAIIHPSEDITIPANSVVPVGVTARDPDFLLRRVVLKRELNGEELPAITLFNAPPEMADLRHIHKLDLTTVGVQPGDRLTIFAEAEDNFEPFGKRQKNIARSTRITLTIAQPAPPQEKQRVEEKQEEELQSKLQADDAANRRGEENTEPQPKSEKEPSDAQNPPQPQKQKEGERMSENEKSPEDGMMSKDQQEQSEDGGKSKQGTPQQQKSGGSEGQQSSDQSKETEQSGMSQDKPGEGSGAGQQAQKGNGEPSQEQSKQQPGGMKGTSDGSSGTEGSTSTEPNQQSGSSSSKPEQGKSGSRTDKVGEDQALQRLLDWSREQGDKKGESKPDASQSPQEMPPSQQNSSGDSQGQAEGAPGMKGREDGKQTPSGDSDSSPASPAGEQNQKEGMNGDKTGAGDQSKPDQNQSRGTDMPPANGSDGKPMQGDQKGTSSPTGERKDESQGKGESGASQKSGAEGKQDGTKSDKSGEQSSPGEKTGGTNGGEMKSPASGSPAPSETTPTSSPSKSGEDQKSSSPKQGGTSSDAAAEKKPGADGMNRPSGENMPTPDANSPTQGQPTQGQPRDAGKPASGENDLNKSPSGGEQNGMNSKEGGNPGSMSPNGDRSNNQPPGQQDAPQGGQQQGGQQQGGQQQGGQQQGGQQQGGQQQGGQQQGGQQQGGQQQGGQQQGGQQQGGQQQGGQQQGGQQQGGQQQGGQQQGGQQQGGQQQGGQQQGGQQQGGQQQGGQNGMPAGNESGQGQASNSSQPGPRTTGQGTNQAASSDTSSSDGDQLMNADQADLVNRKKATELALKRLKEQLERGNTPESLTRELGYSQEDLEKFMNRLEERLADPGTDKSAETESARRQFESLLKGLTTDSARQMKGGGERERKATQSFGSGNRPVPPEYRRDSEAYQQKLSK